VGPTLAGQDSRLASFGLLPSVCCCVSARPFFFFPLPHPRGGGLLHRAQYQLLFLAAPFLYNIMETYSSRFLLIFFLTGRCGAYHAKMGVAPFLSLGHAGIGRPADNYSSILIHPELICSFFLGPRLCSISVTGAGGRVGSETACVVRAVKCT